MRTLTVIAVFAILIVATFGAGYLAGNGNGGTRTITSTSTSISTSTTTVSTSSTTAPFFPGAAATAVDSNRSTGLDLVLALNSTTLKIGQTLQVDISIFNALPSAISIPASQDWPFRGVPVALWPACYSTGPMFDTPAYAVVFQGNYTVQQLQSVANVTISFMCMEAASVDHVVLQPDGSQAYLTGSGFGPEPGPYQLSLNFTTNGYWDLLNNSKQVNPPIISHESPSRLPIATQFVPGVYTIAVSDEWGQVAILHFTVANYTPSSGRPAEVVSVTGPIPPYTPGGPEVGVTLKNIGQVPIASLNASLTLPAGVSSPYAFVFNVNSSSPLLPGQSIQATRTLINGGFDSTQEYPLAISGALSNGTQFSYSVQVQIVPPSG